MNAVWAVVRWFGPSSGHPMISGLALGVVAVAAFASFFFYLGYITAPDPVARAAAFMHQCADVGFTPGQCRLLGTMR